MDFWQFVDQPSGILRDNGDLAGWQVTALGAGTAELIEPANALIEMRLMEGDRDASGEVAWRRVDPAAGRIAEFIGTHARLQVADVPSPWTAFDFTGSLAEVSRRAQVEAEKRKIAQALNEAGGDKGRASEILQMNYKALLMKLKEYRID